MTTPTITSAGTGSGIDVELLIEKISDAERVPTESRLNLREVQIQADVSAFNSLKGALSDLQSGLSGIKTTADFATRTASSSDESIFTATASNAAVAGRSTIEVERLASTHKLVSSDYADSDTVVGQGDLTISVGTEAFTLTIDSSNSTLTGIRDAINDSTSNTGVSASILTVDDPLNAGETVARLVLSSNNSGADNAITVTVANDATGTDTDTSGLSNLVYDEGTTENLTEITDAVDALIKIDGFDVTSNTNVFTGALPGVTINALSADVGVEYDLNVSTDTSGVLDKVQSFVTSLNAYKATYDFLTEVDIEEQEAGLLTGDSTARGINSLLTRTITNTVTEGTDDYTTLASIGISITREGEYQLDTDILSQALSQDFDAVAELVAGDNGIANQLDDQLDSFLQSGGVISSREATFDVQLKDIAEQRVDLTQRIESVELRLRRQFTRMDIIVAQFNNTGNFLTQQLEAIAPSNNKK